MMSENKSQHIDSASLLELTTRIVSAYAGNATLTPSELTETITSVSRTLSQLGSTSVEPEQKELTPAVPVKKSVTPDFIVCLEDGQKQKMLKRHILSAHGLTPDDYRAKWGLPRDYPMVAPNYARARSDLAKQFGLGTTPRKASEPVAPAPEAPAPRRGRRAKTAA